MTAPGAATLDGAFRRYNGSAGSGTFSLAARAWKLFQSAMILLGLAGASSSTSDKASCRPFGLAPPNISPSCTDISDCVSVPKPVLPWWRKRTQLVMRDAIMQRPGLWFPYGGQFRHRAPRFWRDGRG